jgi:hypothetical protein
MDVDSDHELDGTTHVERPDQDTPVRGFDNGDPRSPFSEASIVDLLKEDLKELGETKEAYIPVKGFGRAGLQICYHLPDRGKELDDLARKVQREMKDSYSRNLYIAIDTMIHLCSGIYVQPEGVEQPVMLDPENTGYPCLFDERLAELLGMEGEVSSARQVLRKLFGGNEMAIIAHAEKLNRWLQNTKADLSLEIWQVGE